MRDGWVETTLGDAVEFCRSRIDPLALNPDEMLRHWSIPVLDETGGPRDETAREIGSHKFRVRENAVVFSLLNPRIPRFALVVGGDNVVCSTEFAVMQPGPGMLEEFLLVLASSDVFHGVVNSLANGTTKSRERVKSSDLENVSVLLPPLEEQKRIVDLVSSVDAYIAALQQQSDMARTARNAVLHELLSAGGDDWTQTTLGQLCELYQPETISKAKMDDTAPYVVYGANGPVGRYSRFNHEDPDVVVTCRGATCGVVNMTPPNCWITGNAMVVKPRDNRSLKSFLFWALQTSVDVQATISGSAQPQITRTGLEPSKILLPPLEEQKRIVEIVSSMDDVIQSTELAVTDAKNLRSGLLSDLLSGEHEIPESYDVFVGAA